MPNPVKTEQIKDAIKNFDDTTLDRIIAEAKDDERRQILHTIEEYLQTCDEKILNEKLQLKFILKLIQVVQSNNFPVDLSVSQPSFLAKLIKQLLFHKPSNAKWVLENLKQPFNGLFNLELNDFAQFEINILDASEESIALSYCLSKLDLNIDAVDDLYIDIVNDYIQIDSAEAISLALSSYTHEEQRKTMSLRELYTKIVTYDSPNCLIQFIAYIQQNKPEEYKRGFDQEDSFLKKLHLRKLLSGALNAHAPKAVGILLENINCSLVLDEYIQQFSKEGNLVMVLALCRNNFVIAAQYLLHDSLFSNSQEAQEHLYNHLITMLRFSPIEVVDELINAYNQDDNKAALLEIYGHAKQAFLQHASAFSRLNPNKFTDLYDRYNRNEARALAEKAKKDMDYGEARSKLVSMLVNKMKNSTPESPLKPKKSEFNKLPSSKYGSKIFATLMEHISNHTYQNNPGADFSKLCQRRDMITSTRAYDWARRLIPAVLQYSQSEQLIKYPNIDDIRDHAGYPKKCLYSLLYNGEIINNVSFGSYFMVWGHGRLALEKTIGDIEDLIEKMMSAPLGEQASSNPREDKIDYQEELTKFYADAAKLVWLIGNTTPMQRGSGSIAELTLKAIFEYHQLQTPILKPEFPQLDVLDITFPLDDYIKLFPYFCEAGSLPEHLRKPSLSPLSQGEQIVQFYNEINGVALIPRANSSLASNQANSYTEEKIAVSMTPDLADMKQKNYSRHPLVSTTFKPHSSSEDSPSNSSEPQNQNNVIK